MLDSAIGELDFDDPEVRRAFVKETGFLGFCIVYLSHYFTVEPAPFHFLLARDLLDPSVEMLEVIGFRGGAKSVFCSLAFPLYLGVEHLFDFIIIGADTTAQTKLNIANIRYELESNALIREDYGILFDTDKNWSVESLQLLTGVLILGRSRGQKMRGLRHRQFRPQIVLIDDPEDLKWVKKKVNRNATFEWFTSEVIPAVQEDGSKIVLIGNLLHKDALMMRVQKVKNEDGQPLFKFLEFPLLHKKTGEIMWKGKYPNMEAVRKQRSRVVSATAWSREYLLKIVSEADQVIKDADIHRYKNNLLDERDGNGNKKHKIQDAGVGVDFAISQKQEADYTAMVAGVKIKLDDQGKILVLPNPVNEHLGYDGTLKQATKLNAVMPYGTKWYPEDVGYQKAALEGMKKIGLSVYPMRPVSDKKARLETIAPFIIDGTILFPEFGCEALIEQLLGFGSEEHDDLVDAFVFMVMGLLARRVIKDVEKPDRV